MTSPTFKVATFTVDMPEIYQIEVSSVCNLVCGMCPRRVYTRKDKQAFLEMGVLDKLIAEDAFRGSYFVELQMAGEPTLHPRLEEIIHKVKSTGVQVGLSTNGHMFPEFLLDLDYLTISVDNLERDIRFRRNIPHFIAGVKAFAAKAASHGRPLIDLQIIELPGWEDAVATAKKIFRNELARSSCTLRTVPDCFITTMDPLPEDQLPVTTDRCFNPWMSVSIQANGNVTSCCFAWGDDVIFGNIKDKTLKEIWEGEEVAKLREEHQTQNYRPICARCYIRNPVALHWNMFTDYRRRESCS